MIPGGRKALYIPSRIVRVPLPVCRDMLGYGYTSDGWHYFIAFLHQYVKHPGIQIEESVLWRYYSRFAPKSLGEALTGLPKQQLTGTFANLPNWPALPWLHQRLTPRDGNQHFGRFTRKTIASHHIRLCRLYRKIKKQGYRPAGYPDGYIRGYFLKYGDNYRFIVTSGQHRLAVLAVLGKSSFLAKIEPGFPRVVDVKHVHRWPQVRRGVYSPSRAKRVFRLFFQLNGKEKAKRLGLR